MKQICKFNTKPPTISDGGYKKGRLTMWLNLCVSEIENNEEGQSENFQSITDRIVIPEHSIFAFLEAVDKTHIALASSEEIESILNYFQSEEDIEAWKLVRKIQIQGYDCSDNVNCFYLDGVSLWLDKATRVGLVNSISIEKNAKRTKTCLWFGNRNITIDVNAALEALHVIELYALDCYNVTASHLVQIEQCDTVDELRSFCIGAEYPEIPHFKIEESTLCLNP